MLRLHDAHKSRHADFHCFLRSICEPNQRSASVYPVPHGSKSVCLTCQRYINKDFRELLSSTMHSPMFFAYIKVSTMQKHLSAKVDSFEVHSSSRLRLNSVPALTQRFMSTLPLPAHHHSGSSSSSSSLFSSPRTRSHAQTKSHIRSFSKLLRSVFAGRKPKRNSTESSDDSETEQESLGDIIDLFPSCPSTLPQWKGHAVQPCRDRTIRYRFL